MAYDYADIAFFRARFPEFEDPPITDVILQVYLDDAKLSVKDCVFREKTALAHAYLTAHNLSKSGHMNEGGSVTAGPVVEEKVGDLRTKYADPLSNKDKIDSDLESTPYGSAYLRIRRECVMTFNVVVPTGFTAFC